MHNLNANGDFRCPIQLALSWEVVVTHKLYQEIASLVTAWKSELQISSSLTEMSDTSKRLPGLCNYCLLWSGQQPTVLHRGNGNETYHRIEVKDGKFVFCWKWHFDQYCFPAVIKMPFTSPQAWMWQVNYNRKMFLQATKNKMNNWAGGEHLTVAEVIMGEIVD